MFNAVSEAISDSCGKSRRTTTRPLAPLTMRPLPEQIGVLAATVAQAGRLPMVEPENRAALRSLALAVVFAVDGLAG